MKNSKAIIAVLCAMVLIFSLAACAKQKAKTEMVAQIVTDANGQVVTGVDGEVITEEVMAQVVTDASGKAVTEIVTGTNGTPLTTVVNDKYVNVTQVVTAAPSNPTPSPTPTQQPQTGNNSGAYNTTTTKTTTTKSNTSTTKKKKSTTKKPKTAPKAPANVSTLNASATSSSVTLKWKTVNCSGYQIAFSKDGKKWTYLEESYKGYSYTAKNLDSNTDYAFRVRAFNQNGTLKSTSSWKVVKVKTKVNKTSRKIKITVVLPIDGDARDHLTVTVNKKLVANAEVNLSGKNYVITTKEKYSGAVEITAKLKEHGSVTINTDKSECSLKVPLERIPILIDDED